MKDLKISKELMKAVLQKETETLSKDFNFTINEDYIEFSDDGEIQFEYCIYKFAFKCKEWALSEDYEISSYSKYKLDGYNCYMYCSNGEIDEDFTSDTEVEAIIKACEWILNEETL